MTLEEIKQLIDLANETGIAELELERGGSRVRIRRTSSPIHHEVNLPGAPQQSVAPIIHAAPASAPGAADASVVLVKAPIVGTFYEGAGPGSAPFVKPGDSVQSGQVLCIIESMKLMNEIEAETAGIVVARLVENGRPVEYGEALFSLRPL